MDDSVLSPTLVLGAPSDTAMDLDFMDELFLEGCWLETTDGSGFLNQSPPGSNVLSDPLFVWPYSETNSELSTNPSQRSNQDERHRAPYNEPAERGPLATESPPQTMIDVAGCSGGSEDQTIHVCEPGRRWWIGPKASPGPASSVIERLVRALALIKDVIRDKNSLVQIWVPVHKEGRHVLTTNNLPCALYPGCPKLARYRDISVNYQFSAEEDSKELVMGLPGRVFSRKVPEWTPDVRFFRNEEYPRVSHAQQYDVCGTLALPIFEKGSRNCLGVVEVVLTTQKIKYRSELESVCEALEAVDLRSSETLNRNVKVSNMYYQASVPEIQEVLRSACETHRLPLAQTWVPCIQQAKDGSRHSDDNYTLCVSTVDHACHVADLHFRAFHEACSEHHLLKGQGIVGEAFMTNKPCFSDDIASISKTKYPLSHHARMFGLRSAVAIRLRSIHADVADFVLELFLPVDCTDPEEQKKMLTSLSLIIQQFCRSLRVITDKELEEESEFPVSEVTVPSNSRLGMTASLTEVQQSGTAISLFPKQKPMEDSGEKLSKLRQLTKDSNNKTVEYAGDCSTIGEGSCSSLGVGKTSEKRRTKAEKTITLQVLRQYFAGSLKDAAKSIGVCSTTLKRICRQHGIKRWPSRKIKKVGHSLQKLQLVIDSVQGASGAFQIDSFYTNFPELASPNFSGNDPFSTSKRDHPKPTNMQPEGGMFSSQATASKSSSSCSQSSSSSQCCSSRSQQQPRMSHVAGNEYPVVGENFGDGMLKRVRSEAELHASTLDVSKPLQRSRSHKSLRDRHQKENVPTIPRDNSRGSQVVGDFQRVKVTYGDEKTRFRMHNSWGIKELVQEIARRFNIEDMDQFDIKYLDDDSEWVLLTCDADLEECIEIYRSSSESNTIKLSLHASRHHLRGPS